MNRKLSVISLLFIALAGLGIVGAVSIPHCQKVAPHERNLTQVRTAHVDVPAHPFGIVYARLQSDRAFVALNQHLGVLDTSTLTPKLIHKIPLPESPDGATGIAITHDGRYVLVTTYLTSLVVVDAASATAGNRNAVVSILNGTTHHGSGAIEVTITPDDKYAFVSQEIGSTKTNDRGTIDVFKLHLPLGRGPVSGTYIGYLPLHFEVVGSTLSPDGRTLYAASEQRSYNTQHGTLSVIDVEKLKTDPAKALISTAPAGCGGVRSIVSQDGKVVWLTARASNRLLAFDAAKLISKPSEALRASIQTGTSPDNLIFFRNESRILIANSNRFEYAKADAGLGVIDVDAALHGGKAVLGQVPTGFFPREFAISPSGHTILVSVYDSQQVQAVAVDSIP